MMVEMKWLRTFISTAKYENFRQASDELFLTQPAVSKHVKRLEQQLDVKLFDRVGKHVILTAAGAKFLPIAKKWIATYDEGIEEMETWKKGVHRLLKIAVAPQIAASMLPSILSRFMAVHPEIEVVIDVVRSFDIGKKVRSGQVDIGLSRMEPWESEIYYEIIHEDPVVLVAPYDEEQRAMTEAEVLQTYRLLIDNHPTYWEELLPMIRQVQPSIRTLSVTQMDVTKRLIEQRLGISYLPLSMVQEELHREKSMIIPATHIHPPTSLTYFMTKIVTAEIEEFANVWKENS
ncbi:LysR family transcriptional regulator [Bacillus sp. FJAT-42315]|uniref:LysR family transcriptional regulator n=1 Tax=Bacillus sp. FJAT-42315 TaxID=2014077 RepID=UPI001E4280E2|nr:LysR family transcriptional regulator [Bacillus sp. FJAT-42315]